MRKWKWMEFDNVKRHRRSCLHMNAYYAERLGKVLVAAAKKVLDEKVDDDHMDNGLVIDMGYRAGDGTVNFVKVYVEAESGDRDDDTYYETRIKVTDMKEVHLDNVPY